MGGGEGDEVGGGIVGGGVRRGRIRLNVGAVGAAGAFSSPLALFSPAVCVLRAPSSAAQSAGDFVGGVKARRRFKERGLREEGEEQQAAGDGGGHAHGFPFEYATEIPLRNKFWVLLVGDGPASYHYCCILLQPCGMAPRGQRGGDGLGTLLRVSVVRLRGNGRRASGLEGTDGAHDGSERRRAAKGMYACSCRPFGDLNRSK